MQHLQVDKMKKENEIRNLKKKLNKVKNDLSKKLEDETEYITVEKHNRIVKEIQDDLELSMSLLEKEKDKEIDRLYNDSKKLKSMYEAQLLSLRKLQNKSNYNKILERQSKILELSKVFFPKITHQSSTMFNSQTDIKNEMVKNNTDNNNSKTIGNNNRSRSNSKLPNNNTLKENQNNNSNNELNYENLRPFTSYFPSEYVRKKD